MLRNTPGRRRGVVPADAEAVAVGRLRTQPRVEALVDQRVGRRVQRLLEANRTIPCRPASDTSRLLSVGCVLAGVYVDGCAHGATDRRCVCGSAVSDSATPSGKAQPGVSVDRGFRYEGALIVCPLIGTLQ